MEYRRKNSPTDIDPNYFNANKNAKEQIEKLPLIDKLHIKMKKPDLPLSVRDIKYGAEKMIPVGEYKQVNDMLDKLKRDKILNVKN